MTALSDLQSRPITEDQARVLVAYLDAMNLGVRLQIEIARERLHNSDGVDREHAALAFAVSVLDQFNRGL